MERPMDNQAASIIFYEWVSKVARELERAQNLHPSWPTDPIHAASIIAEEFGELTQAANQFVYENNHGHGMEKEAIHIAAMALRFLMNIEFYRAPKQAGRGFAQEIADGLVTFSKEK